MTGKERKKGRKAERKEGKILFPKQFTVRGSQCFKEWSMVALVLDGLVGFPAGLSPTSFHLSPICLPGWVLVVGFPAEVCPCWRPPFSAGHVTVLLICFPGLSLLVSALLRWRCNISIHSLSRSVTAGVRPFPLAM